MDKGYLSIILHAHLPYVHHPEYHHFYEENWLFEAITECYLPLIWVFDRLLADEAEYRLTLSLSPTLLAMLRDPLLQSRYLNYLHRSLELAGKEIRRTRDQPDYRELAEMYREKLRRCLCSYRDHYQGDLISAFVKHSQAGRLELVTTAATHGFLPLLNVSETAVRNQIKVGVEFFEACTGRRPRGFWLPECAYYPGLEKLLYESGIAYFIVDTHGVMHADQQPQNGVYAPLDCGNGVAVFGRDPASSSQVWSAAEGYPGDADYREYYRDIGFDMDLDYIAPYILNEKTRINTGFKYHRVTGKNLPKAIYRPHRALAKAKLHAEHFVGQRRSQCDALSSEMDRPPIIVAPYDAELFGHWWYEGPEWLEEVLRLCWQDSVRTVSCGDYLDLGLPLQTAVPSASSWGDKGYSAHWLNGSNAWVYPLIHKAGEELEKLVGDLKGLAVNAIQQRALNQALRSLLLAQASDWPFILKSGTTVEYAKKSVMDHLARFNYLHDAIRKNRVNERYLMALEIMDDIFPDIDFRDYSKPTGQG